VRSCRRGQSPRQILERPSQQLLPCKLLKQDIANRQSEIAQARIFKVDAEFAKQVAQMGFEKEPFESLVKMQIFKVTPEFVAEMRKLVTGTPGDALARYFFVDLTTGSVVRMVNTYNEPRLRWAGFSGRSREADLWHASSA